MLALDRKMQELSESARAKLLELSPEQKLKQQEDVLKYRFASWLQGKPLTPRPKRKPKKAKPKKISAEEAVLDMLAQNMSLSEIASARNIKLSTAIAHLERLKGKGALPAAEQLRAILPEDEFDLIKSEFDRSEDGRLTPIHEKFGGKYDFDTLKIVRLFCDWD